MKRRKEEKVLTFHNDGGLIIHNREHLSQGPSVVLCNRKISLFIGLSVMLYIIINLNNIEIFSKINKIK